MQYDGLTECSRCGSDACYVQEVTSEVKLEFCYGCGFQSHSLMKPETEFFAEQLALLPDLYKSLMEEEEETGKVWMPSFINVEEKGMVFADGTGRDNFSSLVSFFALEEDSLFESFEFVFKLPMITIIKKLNFII